MVPVVPPARARRTRRPAGVAVATSAALHALVLGAASLLLGETRRPAVAAEREAVVRIDLRRDRPTLEPLVVRAESRAGIPPIVDEAIAVLEPVDHEAWVEAPPASDEIAPLARSDAEFPELASASRGVVRVPRRARPESPGVAAVGAGAAGNGLAGASSGNGASTLASGTGGTSGSGDSPGHGLAAARAIDAPPPAYPAESRRRNEQGTVFCRIHVRADGTVESVDVVTSSGSDRLDRSAQEGLRRWRFEPMRMYGEPAASTVYQSVRFHLR